MVPGTARVSWYQKGKTILDLLEQGIVSGSGISWDICKSTFCPRQLTTPASPHSIFTGWMPFLSFNQPRQSTETELPITNNKIIDLKPNNIN